MDRSMKVMFGMMTVAICLMALSMTGNQSQQAYAGEYVGEADRGTEPTIVSFRVVISSSDQHWAYRMWSDGAIEINFLGSSYYACDGDFDQVTESDCKDPVYGWVLIQDSVAGYACVGDTDGNRDVNVTDLMAVIDNWGECEQDPPMNIPPDLDLM